MVCPLPLTRADARRLHGITEYLPAKKPRSPRPALLHQIDEQTHPKSSITLTEATEQRLEVADLEVADLEVADLEVADLEVTTRERHEDPDLR